MTRAHFERLIGDIVARTLAPCKRALADARKSPGDIAEVILSAARRVFRSCKRAWRQPR
jgi:molecular chaperone DnaK (HSP70)